MHFISNGLAPIHDFGCHNSVALKAVILSDVANHIAKMNSSDESTLEERKFILESKKVEIEEKKYELAKRGHGIDLLSKVALPCALLVLSITTFLTNKRAEEDRAAFDADVKRIELRQKEDEVFLRKSDAERSNDLRKAEFIQKHFNLIIDPLPEKQWQIEALAQTTFSTNDYPDVLKKISQVRASTIKAAISTQPILQPPSSAEFKARGLQFVAANNFEQAQQNFETATLLQASDAEAWNFKAYAEMRMGNLDAALKSITTSTLLRPMDKSLQIKVMINATKIFCSLDRKDEALAYINKSLAVFPDLFERAKGDGELRQRCNFFFGIQ